MQFCHIFLGTGYWLLVTRYLSLVTRNLSLVTRNLSLVTARFHYSLPYGGQALILYSIRNMLFDILSFVGFISSYPLKL